MRRPLLQDDAFLADIASTRARARSATAPKLAVWWLGQSGFLVLWNDRFLLLDPYLSDSLTRKYAQTDKPHVRMTERVVDPARLDFLDLVTSSHLHTDHLDPETLRPLAAANPGLVLVGPEANRTTQAERSGLPPSRILGLDHPGPALDHGPFRIHPVPAAHETMERDRHGHLIHLGFVVEAGPFRIYHSGDTVPYEGQDGLLCDFRIDLALLPINGRAPERRVAGNLWGREAARLAKGIGARLVVPCHYDMFEFNTATPEEFEAACRQLGQSFRTLQQGERLDWPQPAPGPTTECRA